MNASDARALTKNAEDCVAGANKEFHNELICLIKSAAEKAENKIFGFIDIPIAVKNKLEADGFIVNTEFDPYDGTTTTISW